jgi:hypothetical protein
MKAQGQAGAGIPPSRRAFHKIFGVPLRIAGCVALALGAGIAPIASVGVATAAPAVAAPVQHGVHLRGRGGGAGFDFGFGRGQGRHVGRLATGTVTEIGSNAFTLVTRGGVTVDVEVSGSTRYTEPGVPNGTTVGFGSITVGDLVQVRGMEAGKGTLDAASVNIPEARASGYVSSVSSTEIVLAPAETSLTSTSVTVDVQVTSSTAFKDPGVSGPSASDVLVGDKVLVVGLQGGATQGTVTVHATGVYIPLVSYMGTVGGLSSSGFTLTSTSSTVTVSVEVTSATRYLVPGARPAGLANLANGDLARVVGNQEGTNKVIAVVVQVLAPSRPRGHHRGFGPGAGRGVGKGQGGPGLGWGAGGPGRAPGGPGRGPSGTGTGRASGPSFGGGHHGRGKR